MLEVDVVVVAVVVEAVSRFQRYLIDSRQLSGFNTHKLFCSRGRMVKCFPAAHELKLSA